MSSTAVVVVCMHARAEETMMAELAIVMVDGVVAVVVAVAVIMGRVRACVAGGAHLRHAPLP